MVVAVVEAFALSRNPIIVSSFVVAGNRMATTAAQTIAQASKGRQRKPLFFFPIFEVLVVAANRRKRPELLSGGRGRRFKSSHSDHNINHLEIKQTKRSLSGNHMATNSRNSVATSQLSIGQPTLRSDTRR